MNQNHHWILLNEVPSRYLNSNIDGNPPSAVEDDRVPLRFVPSRRELEKNVLNDLRIPKRFLKTLEPAKNQPGHEICF